MTCGALKSSWNYCFILVGNPPVLPVQLMFGPKYRIPKTTLIIGYLVFDLSWSWCWWETLPWGITADRTSNIYITGTYQLVYTRRIFRDPIPKQLSFASAVMLFFHSCSWPNPVLSTLWFLIYLSEPFAIGQSTCVMGSPMRFLTTTWHGTAMGCFRILSPNACPSVSNCIKPSRIL